MTHLSSSAHRFSFVRSLHLADAVTMTNAAAGLGAILATLSFADTQQPWRLALAAALLGVALTADAVDGAVARARHTHGEMGRELDSLADVISFGVAPAAVAYASGLNHVLDVAVLVVLVCCGVGRLARYNVTAAQLGGPGGRVPFYQGTPITFVLPWVLLLTVSVVAGHGGALLPGGVVGEGMWAFHPLSLGLLVSAAAMVSRTLRIPKP